jgi:hypothetical protein
MLTIMSDVIGSWKPGSVSRRTASAFSIALVPCRVVTKNCGPILPPPPQRGGTRIDGESYNIVGVMPQGFDYPASDVKIWMPVWRKLSLNAPASHACRSCTGAKSRVKNPSFTL